MNKENRNPMRNKLIDYFNDCYKEDCGELNLWNILKTKKSERWIFQKQDFLINGDYPRTSIPKEIAQRIHDELIAKKREKRLIYVSACVIGKTVIKGRSTSLCSPLIIYDAEIELQENAFVSIDHSSAQLNESLLSSLSEEKTSMESLASELFNDDQVIERLLAWFQNYCPDVDSLSLVRFPELVSESYIRTNMNHSLSLQPFSMLALVDRNRGSRGIIHELDEIAERECSRPMNVLMNEQQDRIQRRSIMANCLTGVLSAAQTKALSIAENSSLGLVTGPPGTGKSYTIAAVATEQMLRGKSVLICAANEHALEVISKKIEQDFNLSDVIIRAGEKAYLKRIKMYLGDLLKGSIQSDNATHLKKQFRQLKNLLSQTTSQEKRFDSAKLRAIKRSKILVQLETEQIKWFKRFRHRWLKKQINNAEVLTHFMQLLDKTQIARNAHIQQYLTELKKANLSHVLKNHRKTIVQFNKAIRARTSSNQESYFENVDIQQLFLAFPIWLVNLKSLHRVIPLQRELFDLVIIDESTQCNIAASLPALFRAKKALIVGDDKQLNHFSFVSTRKEEQIRKKHQLTDSEAISYRKKSIYDYAFDSIDEHRSVVMLDEHFRSVPELIHFSNQQFYNDQLKIMTQRPHCNTSQLKFVSAHGVRNENGVNVEEAMLVIETLQQCILNDQRLGLNKSYGIISPFRAQVDYINERLLDSHSFIDDEKESHQEPIDLDFPSITARTPFQFQGEERDVILLSFVVDNQSKRSLTYLNDPLMFNVAVTRARSSMFVFYSIDLNSLPSQHLLSKYLNSSNDTIKKDRLIVESDEFQQRVAAHLESVGFEVWKGYIVAGIELDLLVKLNKQFIAIDLIGYPGYWHDDHSIQSFQVLKRAGLTLLPISYDDWLFKREDVVRRLMLNLS